MPFFSKEAHAEFSWWERNLDLVNGKRSFPIDPDITICSDASLSGWGACYDGVKPRGPWTKTDTARHINELELLAAYNALLSLAGQSQEISIRICLDRSTVVSYFNKCGGTRSRSLCSLDKKLTD